MPREVLVIVKKWKCFKSAIYNWQVSYAGWAKIIAQTKIIAAPSLLSEQIGQLRVGETVKVKTKIGQWLEIRSPNNERGYIFAQDAIEVQQ